MNQLKQFIDSLKTTSNAPLIEAAMACYNSLFEGYADVVSVSQIDGNAFSRAQNFAASINPAMGVIHQSQRKLDSLYTDDDDSWLDNRYTSDVARYEPTTPIEYDPTGDIHEDSLGITARDLANKQMPATSQHDYGNAKKTRRKLSVDLTGF